MIHVQLNLDAVTLKQLGEPLLIHCAAELEDGDSGSVQREDATGKLVSVGFWTFENEELYDEEGDVE